jgi:hypothetical protein
MDSKSGTGIRPGSRPSLQPCTPPSRASRTTASTSSTCRAADDVLANRLRRAAGLDLGNHAERFQARWRFPRRGCRAARRHGVGDRLLQCGGVNARVLANVERVQMQAEGAHLQDERIDERARDAQAAILGQRGAQGFQIVEKLIDRAVGGQHLRQLLLPCASVYEVTGSGAPAGRDAAALLSCSSVRCTRALRQMTKRR